MKKFLSVVLVFATITCLSVGLTGCNKMFASKLEEEIVGTWVSPDIGEVTFNQDGSFSGTLPFEILIDIDGIYTVESGDEIIVEFYYSDEFYKRILDVALEEDNLSISYFMQGTSGLYTRKTDMSYEEENYENEYQEPEETTTQSTEFMVEKNDDGVYDLFGVDNNSVRKYTVKYLSGEFNDIVYEDDGGHLFFFGDEDMSIPVYNKNETLAIYYDTDEIELIKITGNAHYTADLNFEDGIYSGVLKYSKYPGDLVLGNSVFNFHDSDELEANGKDYYEFLYDRTIKLAVDRGLYDDYYIILDAQKGEKFTFGGYHGTEWVEYDFYTDIPFWVQDSYEKITVPVEKTRNGYFTVDLSHLESGTYLVEDKIIIEITD